MTQDLFRKEVLEARRTSWLGAISLSQPMRAWVLTTAAVVVATTVILFLLLGTYTRRSRVVGQLVPARGLATVLAPATGVMEQVAVAEGDRVKAGEVLAVVRVPRATVAGGNTLAAMEAHLERRHDGLVQGQAAQSRLLSVQALGLRAQLASARSELAQIEAEVATRQEQVRLARDSLARLRQLQQQKYVSDVQAKQQESVGLEQTSEAQVLQRQAITARRTIAQLQQAILELPAQQQNTDASYQRELAVLDQERLEAEASGELAVTAPVTGIIATQISKPGQAVQAGQPVLSVLPGNGRLDAELLVPSRAIGFIEPGDRVLLRYQAYPYQKFGHHSGRVARISRSALTAGELGALIGNMQSTEPYYRVVVELQRQAVTAYGRSEPLKPGMVLDADILGEQRGLIEWVLEPLYSLKGKVAGD
jgi:membrane fusion protein